uniref:C2H2-type domain-containing protein n=1 Tax=Mola mola TaxID=94237 RepID=A0A3Q3X4F9_MOLML
MLVFHDETEIEDFEYNEDTDTYYFRCPCGDEFAITEVSGRRLPSPPPPPTVIPHELHGVHTGEKPFSCNICSERFTKVVQLNKHKRVGEKSESK